MKKANPKTCTCAAVTGSPYWACCVCRDWNLQERTACKNCRHKRGTDREATP